MPNITHFLPISQMNYPLPPKGLNAVELELSKALNHFEPNAARAIGHRKIYFILKAGQHPPPTQTSQLNALGIADASVTENPAKTGNQLVSFTAVPEQGSNTGRQILKGLELENPLELY